MGPCLLSILPLSVQSRITSLPLPQAVVGMSANAPARAMMARVLRMTVGGGDPRAVRPITVSIPSAGLGDVGGDWACRRSDVGQGTADPVRPGAVVVGGHVRARRCPEPLAQRRVAQPNDRRRQRTGVPGPHDQTVALVAHQAARYGAHRVGGYDG